MKVPLVGDRIERSEDFPFVPFTRAYASAVFRFFAFTSSPAGCKLQMLIALGVKVFVRFCVHGVGAISDETFSAFR